MHLVPRPARPATGPLLEVHPARLARIGDTDEVRRLLPGPRRTVGAWCFLDHFGPHVVPAGSIGVAPHPHVGLQTVTWLLEGEMLHLDSLGSRQVIAPGQVNWMTAGRGIAHAEENRFPSTGLANVHGVQLWVALPESARHGPPAFDHHAHVPTVTLGWADGAQARAQVLVGAFAGVRAEARTFTELLAVDLAVPPGTWSIPLDPRFEHGVAVVSGEAAVEGARASVGAILHLGLGRSAARITVDRPARMVLLGGAPFDEPLLMWWNFVARTDDEVRAAIAAWALGVPVPGAAQPPLPAPILASPGS
jgi:redox-sensitive bicupin YhaK (pirin superfamily)